METEARQRSFWVVVLVSVVYGLVGFAFALPASHIQGWRLAAWIVSGLVYGIHLLFERFRVGNSSLTSALHVALAAALGALWLAVVANLHSLSVQSTSQHRRLLLVALVAWPLITGVPAFLVGLGASGVLGQRWRGGRSK